MTGIEEILIGAVIKGGAGSVAKVATDSLLDGGGWLAKTFGNNLREGTKKNRSQLLVFTPETRIRSCSRISQNTFIINFFVFSLRLVRNLSQ